MTLNLLEKIAVGTGIAGALLTLGHVLDKTTQAIEDPYVLGLTAIKVVGAVYSRTRRRNNKTGSLYDR